MQDGRHLGIMTLLSRNMTSSVFVMEVKGNLFRRFIYPPSLVVIAFIVSKLRSGVESGPLPGPKRIKARSG